MFVERLSALRIGQSVQPVWKVGALFFDSCFCSLPSVNKRFDVKKHKNDCSSSQLLYCHACKAAVNKPTTRMQLEVTLSDTGWPGTLTVKVSKGGFQFCCACRTF